MPLLTRKKSGAQRQETKAQNIEMMGRNQDSQKAGRQLKEGAEFCFLIYFYSITRILCWKRIINGSARLLARLLPGRIGQTLEWGRTGASDSIGTRLRNLRAAKGHGISRDSVQAGRCEGKPRGSGDGVRSVMDCPWPERALGLQR